MSVKIAQLKASLAKYLRLAQSGNEVIILDRTHPIAKIVPFKEDTPFKLERIKPALNPKDLAKLKGFRQKGAADDIVDLLLEERRSR